MKMARTSQVVAVIFALPIIEVISSGEHFAGLWAHNPR
jgi:hypothetical protein